MTEENRKPAEAEERLQELYGKLADLIPEALADDFVGMGYAKGRYYDAADTRILIVEKVPRPKQESGHGCCCGQEQQYNHDKHEHGQKEHESENGCGHHEHGHGHQQPGHGHHQFGHGQEDDKDFTGVIARITKELLGTANWQDNVAWTYLYKLAPKTGKPDQVIYSKQKELCEEIIKTEIEALKPTLVLFLTGWGSVWNFGLPLSSLLKGEAVEGWGRAENGADLIVTRYAVRKPDDKFAVDILEKIKCLEELDEGNAGIK